MSSYANESAETVICPHCGEDHGEDLAEGILTCDACGKPFQLLIDRTVTYTTRCTGCTGWCWKEPEPVPVRRVLLDLWTSEQIVEQRSAGWGLFVTERDTCPSPVSRFIRVHYDDVAGFFIEVEVPND